MLQKLASFAGIHEAGAEEHVTEYAQGAHVFEPNPRLFILNRGSVAVFGTERLAQKLRYKPLDLERSSRREARRLEDEESHDAMGRVLRTLARRAPSAGAAPRMPSLEERPPAAAARSPSVERPTGQESDFTNPVRAVGGAETFSRTSAAALPRELPGPPEPPEAHAAPDAGGATLAPPAAWSRLKGSGFVKSLSVGRVPSSEAELTARPDVRVRPLASYGQAFWSGHRVLAKEPVLAFVVTKRKWRALVGDATASLALEVQSFLQEHPPPPRTKWTRRVPHPVLSGHAASLTPY